MHWIVRHRQAFAYILLTGMMILALLLEANNRHNDNERAIEQTEQLAASVASICKIQAVGLRQAEIRNEIARSLGIVVGTVVEVLAESTEKTALKQRLSAELIDLQEDIDSLGAPAFPQSCSVESILGGRR